MAIHIFRKISLFAGCFLLVALVAWKLALPTNHVTSFDGQMAFQDVLQQVSFGPRIPDSQAHANTILYIQKQLEQAGWHSRIQDVPWQGYEVKNIIAYRSSEPAKIILGAHYDSRMLADQDTGPGRNTPVPGANDGASGVAVLLELARTLPKNVRSTWLVFFDAEDNGGLDGRAWIMGSRAFVADLTFQPSAVVILDMVGDTNLNIYIESNSDKRLVTQIWGEAAKLGYDKQFIPTVKYSMEDDHTPFLEAGIHAVDIIDFDYPYWHTAADTPDKVSPESLKVVGQTILNWIAEQH